MLKMFPLLVPWLYVGSSDPATCTTANGALSAAPLALAGHLVSVTMSFTAADKVYGAGRVAKLTMKKTKSVKSDHVVLNNTSRTEFLQHVLRIHDLTDQYSPGVHMGPGFKFAWTGSPYVLLYCYISRFLLT